MAVGAILALMVTAGCTAEPRRIGSEPTSSPDAGTTGTEEETRDAPPTRHRSPSRPRSTGG